MYLSHRHVFVVADAVVNVLGADITLEQGSKSTRTRKEKNKGKGEKEELGRVQLRCHDGWKKEYLGGKLNY